MRRVFIRLFSRRLLRAHCGRAPGKYIRFLIPVAVHFSFFWGVKLNTSLNEAGLWHSWLSLGWSLAFCSDLSGVGDPRVPTSWMRPLAWFSPGLCGCFGNEPPDGRSHCLCLSISLPLCLSKSIKINLKKFSMRTVLMSSVLFGAIKCYVCRAL